MTMKFAAAGVSACLCLALAGAVDAAPQRNEPVYQAAEADRAGALKLVESIVNIRFPLNSLRRPRSMFSLDMATRHERAALESW
jgi:hypothetical protein